MKYFAPPRKRWGFFVSAARDTIGLVTCLSGKGTGIVRSMLSWLLSAHGMFVICRSGDQSAIVNDEIFSWPCCQSVSRCPMNQGDAAISGSRSNKRQGISSPAFVVSRFIISRYFFRPIPDEKIILSKVRLRALLLKLPMFIPGLNSTSSPILTSVTGTAAQVLTPPFSKQT